MAVHVADGAARGLAAFSWRQLLDSSARIANLLDSLGLPDGARIALQTEKSVEALILYLAVLRAGFIFLPLNPAYRAAEIEYFLRDAGPSVLVCDGRSLEQYAAPARQAGTAHVFSLNDDGTRKPARGGGGPRRSSSSPSRVQADDLAVILYTSGTTGRSKGAMLSHGNLLANAATLQRVLGLARERCADPCAADLPRARPVRRRAGRALQRQPMIWFNRFDARAIVQRLPEASVFMGVPTLYVRMLQEGGLTQRGMRQHAVVRRRARRRCCRTPSTAGANAPVTPSSSATA